jgi:hypothetical protein
MQPPLERDYHKGHIHIVGIDGSYDYQRMQGEISHHIWGNNDGYRFASERAFGSDQIPVLLPFYIRYYYFHRRNSRKARKKKFS